MLKARLSDTNEAWVALTLIEAWRHTREMSRNLPRAIRLYDALLKGDLSVLELYFPYLTAALGSTRPNTPALRRGDRPAITVAEKSEGDDVADLLSSLGI